MELVYLWVEEYKNIKEQGFNFSPRFDCKYDKETNELTIDENEDYVNIFPDNINITAIVGENGSGKSTLIELMNKFFYFSHEEKSFFIYNINNQLYLYSSNKYEIKNLKEQKNIIHVLSHETRNLFENIHAITYNNERKKFYSNLSMNEFNLTSSNSSHINKNLLKTFTKIENKEIFEDIFQPKFVDIIIRIDKLEDDIEKYKQTIQSKINTQIKNLYSHQNYQKRSDVIDIVFKILEIKSNHNNVLNHHKTSNIRDIYKESRKKHEIASKYSLDTVNDLEFRVNYQNLNFPQPQYKNPIPKNITFCKLEINNLSNEMIDFIWKLPDIAFQINIKNEKNMDFDSLSFGEKNLLTILSYFINLAENKTYKQWGTEVDEIEDLDTGEKFELEHDILYDEIINHKFFLIDECELGIHPNWQKEILYKLINFFKNYTNSIHLILTTHSPFLLSDIPKENIIFLNKYLEQDNEIKENKQALGNCKNVTKDINIKQTFGANIHTLLSNSFFMQNGLMGEFAKGKIEEIKKFYEVIKFFEKRIHQKPYSYLKLIHRFKIKNFQHIQTIIGEPFLQTVMKNYLDEIQLLLSEDNTLIDNEINQLEEKIKKLKRLKNG